MMREPAIVHRTDQTQLTKEDQYLEAMNRKHAIIDNVGGKTVIASWDPSLIDRTKIVVSYKKKFDFELQYSNRFVMVSAPNRQGGVDSKPQPLGRWWLAHPRRAQYRGVTFAPGEDQVVDGCLNIWQGWGCDPVPGDWGLIREHIVDVVANGDAEAAEYVIRWVAWAIQNPDKQAEVALVLMGEKGAGKGTLGKCLRRIFGPHAFQVTTPDEVVGKFNEHLQDCILLIADEAHWSGDKKAIGRLQGMITEPTLSIEPKGIGRFQVRNLLHILMLAEPGWVIPAGRHERRYAALEVSDVRLRDGPYFDALHRQIAEGGAEAMFYDLQRIDLRDWHPRQLPDSLLRSAALQRQQMHTLPPLEQWYLALLRDGRLPGATLKKPNFALTSNLREHARAIVPALRWSWSDNALANFLDRDEGKGIGNVCKKTRTSAANGWTFPPLAECRAAWEHTYGLVKWDNPGADWSGLEPTAKPSFLDMIIGAEGQMIVPVKDDPPLPPAVVVKPAWRRF